MSYFGDDGSDRAEALFGPAATLSSWRKAATFNASQVPVPGAIEVQAAPEYVDLTIDSLRVALAWDDATVAESGAVLELQAGQLGKLDVSSRKGATLEVWVTGWDELGAARVFTRAAADAREDERADADQNDGNRPPASPPDLTTALYVAGGVAALVLAIKLFGR